KKNGLKRFCASSISRSGFHVINLFIFYLSWSELKPSRCIALTAYCQSRPESCVRRGTGAVESKRPATSPDCEVFQSLTHFLRSEDFSRRVGNQRRYNRFNSRT